MATTALWARAAHHAGRLPHLLLVVALVAAACSGAVADPAGVQIPKPANGDLLEEVMGGINTGPSRDTLQSIKDAKLFTPAALEAFLTSLVTAMRAMPGSSSSWQQVPRQHEHLVAYLRVQQHDTALSILRRALSDPGQKGSPSDFVAFAANFDADEFLKFAANRLREDRPEQGSSESTRRKKPTAKQPSKPAPEPKAKPATKQAPHPKAAAKPKGTPPKAAPKPKGTPPKAAPKPKATPPKAAPRPKATPPKAAPKPATKPTKPQPRTPKRAKSPKRPKAKYDPSKDPLLQLYDWDDRVKALAGSIQFLAQDPNKGHRRLLSSASLGSYTDDFDLVNRLVDSAGVRDMGKGGVGDEVEVSGRMLQQQQSLPAPPPPPAPARGKSMTPPAKKAAAAAAAKAQAAALNVGYKSFKPLRIGVVFHMLQFRDKRNYLYPPQAYWSGDEAGQRLVKIANKIYKYSGTNIQFYVKEFRTNTTKYPYLDIRSLQKWQSCADIAVAGTCICNLASKHNVQGQKYINVFVSGSEAYRQGGVEPEPAPKEVSNGLSGTNAGTFDNCSPQIKTSNGSIIEYRWDPKKSPSRQFVWMRFDRVDLLQDNSINRWNSGGVTLAHEVGHVLGLEHVFGSGLLEDEVCEGGPGDFVADTPRETPVGGWKDDDDKLRELINVCQVLATRGWLPMKGQLEKFDTCPGDGYIDNVFNVMAYVPAPCRLMFTRGQVRRMQASIQKYLRQLGGR